MCVCVVPARGIARFHPSPALDRPFQRGVGCSGGTRTTSKGQERRWKGVCAKCSVPAKSVAFLTPFCDFDPGNIFLCMSLSLFPLSLLWSLPSSPPSLPPASELDRAARPLVHTRSPVCPRSTFTPRSRSLVLIYDAACRNTNTNTYAKLQTPYYPRSLLPPRLLFELPDGLRCARGRFLGELHVRIKVRLARTAHTHTHTHVPMP